MKKSHFLLLVFFAISSVFISCKKDDDDSTTPITPTGATIKTSVTGRIIDTNGILVSGAIVKLGNITTVSDNRGNFLFVNIDVPKTRMVLNASKAGFFNTIKAKKTQAGAANYINMVLEAQPAPVLIGGVSGGVVTVSGGAGITFPTNSFVDQNGNAYNGQVKVYARHFSPGNDNFEATVPGGDLTGVTTSGQTQSLYSFGMIEVKLLDNSGVNEIKLAPGKTAELKFPIDPSQTSAALTTIPMWHLDETTGIWQEEGQATKTGGYFIGNVSHFSTWNCDYSGERTDIKGTVVDCQNNPMVNVVVTINGFSNVVTDNTGSYTTWVPAGYQIDCQVLIANNPFLTVNSPVQSITAVAGQLNIVPPIVVACATQISGTIKTCGGVSTSPGIIYISWSTGNYFQICNSGTYQLIAPENTQVLITAYTAGLSGTLPILTGTVGTNISSTEIQLCDPTSLGQNKFSITTNGITTNYLFSSIATTSGASYYDLDSDGDLDDADIYVDGYVMPGNLPCNVYMYIDLDDNFSPNNLYISSTVGITLNSIDYFSGDLDSSIYTTNSAFVTDFGIADSPTSGVFQFDSGNSHITNGQFSVNRNF